MTNIPFDISEPELRGLFAKYGSVTELKIIVDNRRIYDIENTSGTQYNKGYCYVSYENNQDCLLAFSELDNRVVWGRILHVRPSYQEKTSHNQYQAYYDSLKTGRAEQEGSSFKKLKKKSQLDYKTNWSTLFLNQNTILSYVADKYQVDKSTVLQQQDSEEQAVRIALAETEAIQETIKFLKAQAVDMSFLEENRTMTLRSDRVILVKNIQYNTTRQNLSELFGFYGQVVRLLVAPNNAIGIVEFSDAQNAENAFS